MLNKIGLNLKNRGRAGGTVCIAVLLMCFGLSSTASSNAVVPDDQKALLTVRGQGANPFAQIALSTGPQQTITTKADKDGQFLFSNLQYASFADLKFSLDIPPYEKGLAGVYPGNHLEFKYDAKESIARISGQIGKYGTLALNLAGAVDGVMRFAGNEGYVASQTRTAQQMASGQSSLTASIINAGEICCPRMIIPASPLTLTILSKPLVNAPPVVLPQKKNVSVPGILRPQAMPAVPQDTNPVPPVNTQSVPKKANPYILSPNREKSSPGNQQEEKQPKVKVPYIVRGSVEIAPTIIGADEVLAATSFSSSDYNATYVGGLKNIADSDRNTMMMKVATLGAFIDARTNLDTLRSLQMSVVQTLKNYTTSEAVCKFGTMTQSIASADAVSRKNQLAFSKILLDRNTQKEGTVYSDPTQGLSNVLNNFKGKYCSVKDNNTFLDGYCKTATATSDQLYNRDVDFTRVFDVPLTLDADFSDETLTKDKQSVIALFDNLSMTPPVMSSEGSAFDPRNNSDATQDIRSLSAMKTVTANSFAALVGDKVKSTSQSTSYMKEMIRQLGLDATAAEKLLGANPSYFAQMEVLTKKLFQNPAFYANLYDSEANIDRQRVAMKAIELQQDRDFLESLRRREMLLSVLLNAKLRTAASRSDEGGYVTQKP